LHQQSATRPSLDTWPDGPPIGRITAITSTTPASRDTQRTPVDPARIFIALAKEVRDAGLLKRATWFYVLVDVGLVIALGAALTAMFVAGHGWIQVLIAAVIGIIFAQIAFTGHEAAHRQILKTAEGNDRLGRIIINFGAGMSYQWWNSKHSLHHAEPNVIGVDPDIGDGVVVFTHETAARRRNWAAAFARKQGWLFYPLLAFEGFNLHVQSIRSLISKGNIKGRWVELGLIAARFAILFTLVFLALPFWLGVVCILIQMMVFGFYLGASFAVNHVGMPLLPPDAHLDFFRKQVLTARNIRGKFWPATLLGGLNYQVEHHLFPNMARPRLAKTREIVLEYCRVNDVTYTEMSFLRANVHVVKYVHEVGLAAKDPWVCPLLQNRGRS